MPRTGWGRSLANPAVLAALVGGFTSFGVALMQRPSTIRETKESISAIAVSDEQLKDLAGSVFRIRSESFLASGFLLEQRYLITTRAIVTRGSRRIQVYRRFGEPDSSSFWIEPAVVDSSTGTVVFDLGVRDTRQTWLELPKRTERRTFDRVFALGYAGGNALTVREGRIVADRVTNPAFYGIDTEKFPIREGTFVADIEIPGGMAGAPVFLRDGTFLGFVYLIIRSSGIALVVPGTYVGDAVLRAKGGS